jgi:hypothetical protein
MFITNVNMKFVDNVHQEQKILHADKQMQGQKLTGTFVFLRNVPMRTLKRVFS